MKERIREVMEYAQMTQQDFANHLGISPATLSSIFTGRSNPGQKQVTAIHQAYPEINVNWLMFGEGEMLVTTANADDAKSPSEQTVAEQPMRTAVAQPARSLFDNELAAPSYSGLEAPRSAYSSRRENAAATHPGSASSKMAINFDKLSRKIKEIRVFFDDGTYESFVPSSK